MFINKIPFLISVSQNLKFTTVQWICGRSAATLVQGLRSIAKIYKNCGFEIKTAFMDGEFESLRPLLNFTLNITATNKHILEVEQMIRIVKERARAIFSVLPFKHIPARMMVELIKFVVLWINAFPSHSGISASVSPQEMVIGYRRDYPKHCQMPFGGFAHFHEDLDTTNNVEQSRTLPAICLGPTGNLQGT